MIAVMVVLKNISLLWLCAFLCSLFFFNAYELESFGLATIFLFIFSIVSLSFLKEWHIPKSYFIYALAAFWLLTFFSVIFSDILNTSIMAFVYFSALPLGFFTIMMTFKNAHFLMMGKCLAVIFAALGLWALCQYFFLHDLFGPRAHHPLKNANSLGALFNFGLFGAVGWMFVAKTRIQRNLSLILSIIILGGILSTVSRGAILAMIVMILPMLFLLRENVKEHWRCLSVLVLSALVFIVLSTFIDKSASNQITARLLETAMSGGAHNMSHRWQIWEATWQMIQSYGLWGTGIGTYFQYFPEYRLTDDVWGTYYAHNDFLQYWVELGVLGPILFYSLCLIVLGRTVQAVKQTNDALMRVKILTPFFAMGAIVLHTHVTFNFYNLSILYMSGLALAYWFCETQKILQTPFMQIKFLKSYSLPARGIVIKYPFLVVGYFFFSMMISESLTQKAKRSLLAGELEDFAYTVIAAKKIGLGHNYRADLLAVNMPITLLSNATSLGEVQKKEIFDQGLSYLQRVRGTNPRSASALYYLGLIQEDVSSDMIPEALKSPVDYYRAALRLDPLHFSARLKIAQSLPAQEGIEVMEAGVHYNYNNPEALALYMALLGRYAKDGNQDKMKEMTDRIQYYQKLFHN